jgi:hypothetical protein
MKIDDLFEEHCRTVDNGLLNRFCEDDIYYVDRCPLCGVEMWTDFCCNCFSEYEEDYNLKT